MKIVILVLLLIANCGVALAVNSDRNFSDKMDEACFDREYNNLRNFFWDKKYTIRHSYPSKHAPQVRKYWKKKLVFIELNGMLYSFPIVNNKERMFLIENYNDGTSYHHAEGVLNGNRVNFEKCLKR